MRCVIVVLALFVVAPAVLHGQIVHIRLDGVGVAYQEFSEDREALGGGGGLDLALRLGKFRVAGRVWAARMVPDSQDVADFTLTQVDVYFHYFVTPLLAIEAGGGRRYVEPEFATQEVGYFRIGVTSENRLNKLASVSIRGAYLPGTRFSGGGDAGLAFELGFGVGVGTANGRFRGFADYEFQRIDRETGLAEVPMQISLARLGFGFGF